MQHRLNSLILIAVFIHPVVTCLAYFEYPFLVWIFGPFAGLSLAGMILLLANKPRAGAYLIFIGSIAFIPIGAIGMVGARKVLDRLKEEEFHKRRGSHERTT